jgi:hypothetical protein
VQSLPQPVYCSGGSQPGQNRVKIPYALSPGEFQGGNKRFLEAVGSISVIAQQPVSGLPDERAVFFNSYLPVNILQANLLLADQLKARQ